MDFSFVMISDVGVRLLKLVMNGNREGGYRKKKNETWVLLALASHQQNSIEE